MGSPSLQSAARSRAAQLESFDPATGEVIARFAVTPLADIPGMILRAREAQREWAAMPLAERCRRMARLRDVLLERRSEIAEIISRENGKPRVEALLAEVLLAAETAAYYARRGRRLLAPERIRHRSPAYKVYAAELRREPVGVIGVISPWNYPFGIPATETIPAVVAGNAVVLKPSELTPWCGALVGELYEQAGFPDGLVQVIQGAGDAGAAMIEAGSPAAGGTEAARGLDKLIFTGSVATGRRVAEACARRLIPTVLELGGKDAMIVLADARLEVAASAAVWGAFTNCGQACISVERLLVEQAVAEEFIALCVGKAQQLRLGRGTDPATDVGPMIRPRQIEIVEEHLADAVARGARILTGGRRRPDFGANFFEPTVVAGADPSMRLMQEETFGPVLAICAVADADEAIRVANDTPFGLSGSIWTADARRGREIAARLQAGAVMVNDLMTYYGACEAPHGGCGASGWGRTHGRQGLEQVVHTKYVAADRLGRWPKAWWYGYNERLVEAGEKLMDALLARSWRRRVRSLGGARGMLPWFRDRQN